MLTGTSSARVCTTSGEGPTCGHGVCLNNGTVCYCAQGFRYDSLLTEYRTCIMPTWVPSAFSASFMVLVLVALSAALIQVRASATLGTKNLYVMASTALASCAAFCIGTVAYDMTPNPLSWTLYLVMMLAHLGGLVPIVTRHIIPPAFHMIFMYPRWFDVALVSYYFIMSVGLAYSWVMCMIALSYNNIRLYNDGVTVWYAICAWLSFQLTATVTIATRDLISAVNHMLPKPFYRDLESLRKRARAFQVFAILFGVASCVLLLFSVSLHFGNGGIFPNRFVLNWALLLLLVLFDAGVIWFGWTGGQRAILSQPRSNADLENEVFEVEPRIRGRTVSFSKSIPVGGALASRLTNLGRIRRGSSIADDVTQVATV